MREIKFRAKRIDMDRWIYGQYFTTPLTDENSGTKPNAGWFFLSGEPRHCIVQSMVAFVIDLKTLGQYTGLKDKNGKEIYEGDVVKHIKIGGMDKSPQIGNVSIHPTQGVKVGNWPINFSHEVIGNIYENPEMGVMDS